MNLILQNSRFVDFHTYLDPIFEAVPELADFTYLISDHEVGWCADKRLAHSPMVIAGHELKKIVDGEKVQFIWAVLSAFNHVPIVPKKPPYADGNPGFWRGTPMPQMPDASFEIVCFDSSATLFIGVDASIAEKLRRKYPDIRILEEENCKAP
jgi:hypothetical protein